VGDCGKYDKKICGTYEEDRESLLSPFGNECELTGPNLRTSRLENYITVSVSL
jgi:hypothetical protein